MLASFAFTPQELTRIEALKAFQEFEPSLRARGIALYTSLDGAAMTTVTRYSIQAHLDEWVKDSGVSEAIARLDLESLDDPRVIVLSATHSTSAIGEVL